MKRIGLILATLLLCNVAMSQSVADTSSQAQNPQTESINTTTPPDSIAAIPEPQKLSRRQQMRYFGHDFSSWFCEVKFLSGQLDAAIGLNLSYNPYIWGGYITVMNGVNAYWASAGVLYRFSGIHSRIDCQAYAGLVAGYGYGAEAGMRIARINRHKKNFSWVSVSMGAAVTNYGSFFTCGLSLPFGIPTAAICIW